MRRLPPHHIARPRLSALCADHDVVVVEAAAGYGKTVLGTELVDSWRAVGIEVDLAHGETNSRLLVARLRSAVLAAGFPGAAAAADGSGDPVEAIDGMLRALGGEHCAFVVDDAHQATPDAAALLQHLAAHLQAGQRLVVLARQLPAGAGKLRRAEYLHLGADDLALNSEETLRLCRAGFGLDVNPDAAGALDQATGGWTAATVLAAARAARTGERVRAIALAATGAEDHAGAVAAILSEALAELGQSLVPSLAQVARLPLFDPALVDITVEVQGFFDRALKAGIPFGPARGLWWDLPGPVQEHLAGLAPTDAGAMRRAAREYSRRGEVAWALQLLLTSGEPAEAADLLANTPPELHETIDAPELQAFFDQLPDDVVDQRPEVLLVVARGLRLATHFEQAKALLERARALATRNGDAVLQRAADAGLAADLVRQLRNTDAEKAARAVLAAAGPEERHTRAGALHVLGQALCWRVGDDGRRDENALAEAEECFRVASALYRALGMPSALSGLAPYWAISLEFARGQAASAMARLDEALALVADRPRRWAYILAFRAWVAAELGLDEICRTSAEEVLRVAEQLNSPLFAAQGHWRLAMLASYRGDAEATLSHLQQVELHKGSWWGAASGDFLADAADLSDRVGLVEPARRYLARVKAEPKDAGHLVALVEAVLEARHGDPFKAEGLLVDAARGRVDPREYWRVTLLRALAALRRGDEAKAATLAARSFEEAAALGQPQLPVVRERTVAEQLVDLAAGTGSLAALALQSSALPVTITLLGRFELRVGGRALALGSSQEGRLLRMVAAHVEGLHVEQAMEGLWPEVGPAAGRHRLRTVLNRLRSTAGALVERHGDLLALAGAVRVDFSELLAQAARAEELASTDLSLAASVARATVLRYRGELLPDDLYEEWAERPRQQARRAMLDMFEICAAEAARRGDLDAMRRMVERAIELAPYDDRSYVRLASALLDDGRRGEALSIVQRARSALSDAGLEAPVALRDLERSILA